MRMKRRRVATGLSRAKNMEFFRGLFFLPMTRRSDLPAMGYLPFERTYRTRLWSSIS